MPYIIAETCIGVKDRSCVDVCPVDCIYEGEDQLYIHPDECIDCGACEPECPVTAIFPEEDTPPQWKSFIAKNRDGATVNRWLTTGFLAASATTNETAFLTYKVVRSTGMLAFDNQARV